MNRVEVQRHVEQMLAAESSCSPEDVLSGEVTVATLRPERFKSPHHRRFQYLEPTLSITTMGTGGIVAASPEWVGWVSELFEGLNRDEIFSWPLLTRVAQKIGDRELYGPIPHFVCSSETARQPATQTGYEIYLFGEGEMPELDPANWPHAVSSQPDPQRPDMLAAVA